MPRMASPGGDDTDDQALAQELGRLQRTYACNDQEKERYTIESQNLLRKQRDEIDLLDQERLNLMKELRLAESRQNAIRDEKHAQKLIELSSATDKKSDLIQTENQKISELDAQIFELELEVKDNDKKMRGVSDADFQMKVQKQIRVLENKVDQATFKFNNMLTHNRKMREQIDNLRHERSKYENLRLKLDQKVEQLRDENGKLIESSTQAYEARDDAQQKMLLLKEKADKDKLQHESEMKELCRILDHDKKLKEFMGIKCQDRSEDPDMVAWRQRKEAREEEKKKEAQEDTIESFEAAWNQIIDLCDDGQTDVQAMADMFEKQEARNFALFNFVTEQNNQIEELREEHESIEDEIRAFNAHGTGLDKEHEDKVQTMDSEQRDLVSEAKRAETNNKKIVKVLDQLRAGIESLFGKINCDQGPITDMLGASVGVTNENMIQYLGIIEQRTNELLAIQSYIKFKEDKFDPPTALPTFSGPQQTQVSNTGAGIPSLGDTYEAPQEEKEDEEKPLGRDELQKKFGYCRDHKGLAQDAVVKTHADRKK